MTVFRSFQQRLTDESQKAEAAILDFWRKSVIEEFGNDPGSGVFFMVHHYYWKRLPIEQRAEQAKLLG
jgi:hypothetical protein